MVRPKWGTVRLLFTSLPAASHVGPALPLAREFRARGWEVAFAASASMEQQVAARGFGFFPVGLDWTESDAAQTFPELETMPLEDQAFWWVSDIFADRAAKPSAADLVAVIERWQPQLVVRDYWDFGAWVAAEACGVPTVVLGLAMFTPAHQWRAAIGPRLQSLRRHVGLAVDETLGSLYDGPYLDLLPPAYQVERPPNATHLRPVSLGAASPEVPDWIASLPDCPTVLVTFGTVFNQVPDVFERVIAGLSDQPVNVIVTTGRNRDPATLGPLPANTRAERFIDYAGLLPRCDAIVCHAGLNTTMAALAHDLPILAIPLSADQSVHAGRCRQLGVGSAMPRSELTPEGVATQVRTILAEPGFGHRAAEVGAEIRDMPGPSAAVDALVRTLVV